jgi:carboxyl-terminal processing protease
MRAQTRWLVNSLERLHFSNRSLEDISMEETLAEYMEALDLSHLYFTAEDLASFQQRFGQPLSRQLRSGQLYPAFRIFTRFEERVRDRIAWVRGYLEEGEVSFDEPLTYETDREEVGWPSAGEEADQLWQRRIQYELLNEIIPLLAPDAEPGEAIAEAEETEDGAEEATADPEPLSFEEALVEAKTIVRERYDRVLKNLERYEPGEVQEIFLTTVAKAFDPHSIYLSADSLEDLSIQIENSLVGIGAVLSQEDGVCTIRDLITGGPAEMDGELQVEDEIVGVAQGEDGEFIDVVGLKLRRIVELIRGEKGTVVRLKIRPGEARDPGVRREVALTRDEVELTANLARARLFQVPSEDGQRTVPVGVITLPSFYGGDRKDRPNSSDDVATLVAKLEERGMEGLLLDLRRNGGGLLSEAVELTGLFIPDGPVVQVRTVRGEISDHRDEDPGVAWRGPLVVLTSEFTASASEIVAGALQNYERAVVVGDESTHGKGTVQGIFPMKRKLFSSEASENSGATKVTVQKYYLPSGDSTQLEGVRADLVVPSLSSHLARGEEDLDHALVWDRVAPIVHGLRPEEREDLVTVTPSLVEALEERSAARRGRLEEFAFLEETIAYYRERQEATAVSLHLEERRRQREENLERNHSFDRWREELREQEYPHEEVTLREGPADSMSGPSDRNGIDIVLREGIRVLADWVELEEEPTPPRLAHGGSS